MAKRNKKVTVETVKVTKAPRTKKTRKPVEQPVVADQKMAAANDQPEPVETPTPDPATAPTEKSAAGVARSAGVQLFIAAGRPKREAFVALFGPKGPAMTWDQRGKLLGVSAEECARTFQSRLAEKAKG